MNKNNRITILVYFFLTALSIAACGKEKEGEVVNVKDLTVTQQESNVQIVENTESEAKGDETVKAKESSAAQQENSVQIVEKTDSEMTAEELLDLFINGSINASDSADLASSFYITDLNVDSYSVGEKIDLDNDGENELVISGPYGGIYLDARNNKVYEFAVGDGNALILSYTYYNGAVWIMYSNNMHAGYESYHMEKFEGADNLVAEMNFSEELVDPDNSESETNYTWNGTIISYDEYTELCSKIFAAQVNTDIMNGTPKACDGADRIQEIQNDSIANSAHINSVEGTEKEEQPVN